MPERARQRLRRRGWIVIVGGLVLLLFFVFSRYGILTRWRAEKHYRELQQRYEELQREADSLSRRLERLKREPVEVERLARERYGMARPEETVYIVPEQPAEVDGAGH